AVSSAMLVGSGSYRAALAQATPPGDDYARPEALVDVAWLQKNMDAPDLVTVGFMPVEEFNIAHIPGSARIAAPELEVIDTSDASIEQWQQTTRQLLGDIGISSASTVVVYDPGTLFAARLWWILHYFGHENVHILDGGLPAWQEAGHEVEEGLAEAPAGSEPYQGTPNADLLAQMDEVMANLEVANAVILDARKLEEYTEGHIPGAVNINFPLNAAPEPPKFWKPASELKALYEEAGVTPDKLVIPYCASGVRSAVTAFSLHLIGYEQLALYTGSWLEWGEDPDTPKTTGDQP
ncbi:MAG TPA: sulfurtransferase, partial [Thermomicrobiales bacterium]|nr:sulfurtransferase [Thermomicrobiales bacterium]